ncbi:MAG: DUF1015 domain-containing protein [Candidatus Bipolaricaulota bacterium]|nr:DUF1015 domain-containing protein [Candidatus Bipolaricaulota bacterium]
MAHIIPFRGVRYSTSHAGEASDLVAQPYDRIGKQEQEIYYERSPYNIVRIIKGRAQPEDNGENVYTRAGSYLQQWLDEGILVRDETPSLYVYHQEYRFGGERLTRKGFIALGKLEPEKVHAHERTLKGPKEDRLRLLRATEGNFGHIFMLYSDPQRDADAALDAAIAGIEPTISAVDDFGNNHYVWQITDPKVIAVVQEAVSDKDLYIADGHHRYETAVNFMRECEQKGWQPAAPESFDARMMTLFNIDEPGMTIRPIHRLVHALAEYDVEAFLMRAEKDFDVKRYSSLTDMQRGVAEGRDHHTFGCYSGGVYASLSLRDERIMDRLIAEDRSHDWKRLDVSILHTVILDQLLGVDAKALEEQRNITYAHGPEEGIAAVDGASEQIFFLLNPTSPSEVRRVADHGEKMPQKSTDFYPKLLTGLVLSKMEIDKG